MSSIMLHLDQPGHDQLMGAMTRLSVVLLILMFGRNRYIVSNGFPAFEMLLKNGSTKSKLG